LRLLGGGWRDKAKGRREGRKEKRGLPPDMPLRKGKKKKKRGNAQR